MTIWTIAILGAMWWLWQAVLVVRTTRAVRPLPPGTVGRLNGEGPMVSVLSPARNEADAIEAASLSRLQDPATWLEFIFIDDRSTDATGSLLDRVAAGDDRMRVIHNDALPDGWLGKVYAQQLGVEAASVSVDGWYVFSDGDTHVLPGAVGAAVAWAERCEADHVALLPRLVRGPVLLRLCSPSLLRALVVVLKMWRANDDDAAGACGVGAFNLVRRSALERAGGLEHLRLEVADDVGLGQIIKDAGGRSRLALGGEWVEIELYRTAKQFMVGSEKGVAKARSRWRMMLVGVVVIVVVGLDVSPFVLVTWWPHPAAMLGAAVSVLALCVNGVLASWFSLSLRWAMLAPVGTVACGLVMLRALGLGLVRGGVRWRGDAYSLKATSEGERVRM